MNSYSKLVRSASSGYKKEALKELDKYLELLIKKRILTSRVLKGMGDFLYNRDFNSHEGGNIAYCDPCKAIVLVSDSYSRYCGRDLERRKQRKQCFHCDSIEFVDLKYNNLEEFKTRYAESAPYVLIEGIKNGIEKVKPINGKYSLCAADYTDLFGIWFAVNEKEKLNQTRALFKQTDKLSKLKKEAIRLDDRIDVLERVF